MRARSLGLAISFALLTGISGAPAQSAKTPAAQIIPVREKKKNGQYEDAQSFLCTLSAYRQDYARTASCYRKTAEQGDAKAQYHLGVLYATGRGVPPDYAQAVVWYLKAAERGDVDAQLNLGIIYANGQGVTQNYTLAVAWYRKAAEQGNADVQFDLGVMYYNGQNVMQDYTEAGFWLNLAATGRLKAADAISARKARDQASSMLMPADLSHVQERVRKWFEDHPENHIMIDP